MLQRVERVAQLTQVAEVVLRVAPMALQLCRPVGTEKTTVYWSGNRPQIRSTGVGTAAKNGGRTPRRQSLSIQFVLQ
jgi:hypothetical protein